MADIRELHPELQTKSVQEHSGGATYLCDFQGQPLALFKPHTDVLSTETEFINKLPDSQVDTLYRPSEEGPCGGVNMAELVLDSLIDYRDATRPKPFDIYGNHPPSKGAERAALYEKHDVVFDSPIDEIPAGNVILFSAHGADPRKIEHAKDRGLYVVDTTCPLVDKIYSHVRKASKSQQEPNQETNPAQTAVVYLAPLYKYDHPEVAGTRGVVETAGFRFIPVRSEDEALELVDGKDEIGPESMNLDGIDRLLVTGLTTNNAREVLGIGKSLAEAADTQYSVLPYNERDVCRTVQYRQEAIEEVVGASLVDEVIILGAVESNNTNELVRKTLATLSEVVAEERRLRRITFGNHFSQLPRSLRGDVLLMSGASTGNRNVAQATTFLNPSAIKQIGKREKLDLFTPLGRNSLARRILAGDFSWLTEVAS